MSENQFDTLLEKEDKLFQMKESRQIQVNSEPLKPVSSRQVVPMDMIQSNSSLILQKKPINYQGNLKLYKKKMFITVTIIFAFLGLIISERLLAQIFKRQEVRMLIEIQEFLKISYTTVEDNEIVYYAYTNFFLWVLSQFQFFLVSYLIQLQFFVTYFTAFDSIMAIKIMYPVFLGEYIIIILQLLYKEARPLWVSADIVSYTCQKTYSSPSITSFYLFLIVFYITALYQDKQVFQNDIQQLVGPKVHRRKWFLIRIIGSILCLSYLFCIYVAGLIFLDHIFLGLIYFGLYFVILRLGGTEISNIIRKTALISDVSKRMIFEWLFALGIIQFFVTIIHNFSDKYPDVVEIQNFIACLQEESRKNILIPRFDIMGPDATYCESSLVFGIIGMIFGVSYTFRNIKNSMHWYQGTPRKRLIRGIIANLCLLPSWILVIYQQKFLQLEWVYNAGLTEFLLDSIHLLLLNFFLFGILPTNIFSRFHLNHENESEQITLKRVETIELND